MTNLGRAQRFLFKAGRGSILIGVLILAMAFTIIGLSLASFAMSQYSLTSRNVYNANALLTAEAGVEQALYELNLDSAFAGHLTEQVMFNDAVQGRGTYVTVISNTGTAKTITATGRTYRYNQTTNPVSTRRVRVTVVGTQSDSYSVFSGPGGLILGGNASITNSDVYVNGTLTMGGNSSIGTYNQPTTLNVAHIACPPGPNPGPTYPSQCMMGEPISMTHSTRIFGSVCATNQTSPGPDNNIQTGATGQGLIAGCTAPSVASPTYDRAAHIAGMTTTAAGNSNLYTCQSPPYNRTWPAGLRLNGNVTISSSCNVTISGNVYITGNLLLSGSARINIADSLGETVPVVVVDGTITSSGTAQAVPNASGTSLEFISFKSTAACNPNCTSVTGNDLKNSQDLLTIDVAGAGNMPGVTFHAYWSKVRISGSGNIGAAAGQTIDLSGAGTIVFGTGLSSGTQTWAVTSYQRIYND